MTVALTWSPGWQASSGVMSDASALFATGAVAVVTAYGTAITSPAVTLLLDAGASTGMGALYLAFSYRRTPKVLVEYSADAVTWSTATVTGWSVYSSGAWTSITASNSGGWSWVGNGGTYGAGAFKAVLSGVTARYLRVSVQETAAIDARVDVAWFNATDTSSNAYTIGQPAGILIGAPITPGVAPAVEAVTPV